jgi:CheY-like chemotaxis protein
MTQILIVDDRSDMRRLMTISLGKGYKLLEAVDGSSAIDVIQRQHPKIVLLDVKMPGAVDGLQVLDFIKGNRATEDILVALMTARGQAVDCEDARRRGADAYFIKPFSPLEVVAWVRRNLK